MCKEGVNREPCGKCSTCLEIDSASHLDLIEIDAASRTKVEDTRNLMDNVQYLPTSSSYKIYLIDADERFKPPIFIIVSDPAGEPVLRYDSTNFLNRLLRSTNSGYMS